jgi:hypothetical protein
MNIAVTTDHFDTESPDRLEVNDETSAHPYRQKGRDCLMTSI